MGQVCLQMGGNECQEWHGRQIIHSLDQWRRRQAERASLVGHPQRVALGGITYLAKNSFSFETCPKCNGQYASQHQGATK